MLNIQWNCRGLKVSYEETLLLLKDYEPAAICLQEPHLKDKDNISIRNYTAFHSFAANNERAAGGVFFSITVLFIVIYLCIQIYKLLQLAKLFIE